MALWEVDTIQNAIKKYSIVALIGASIGMYKGCEIGKASVIEDISKALYEQNIVIESRDGKSLDDELKKHFEDIIRRNDDGKRYNRYR